MSATIPGTAVTSRGVQFFLEMTDGTNTATSPPLASGVRTHDLAVTLTNFPALSAPAGGYRLAGLPMRASNPSPESVFDELGGYDVKKWRYGTYDGGAYREPGGGAAAATPGQGFWIRARTATDIAASGFSTDLSGPVGLVLHEGFNQIANPFGFPVDFAAVARPAEVEGNLIGFDGNGYVGGVATMQPGQGYWIRSNAAGPVTISIPPLGSGVLPAPGGGDPAVAAGGTDGAEWALRVDAVCGRFADRGNLLGARAGAAEGRDVHDLSEPPPPPDGWVRVGFASAQDGELFADWRPAGTDGATWQLTFASDQRGEPFRIDLVAEQELPSGWGVVVHEGARELDLPGALRVAGTVGVTTAPRTFSVSVGDATYLSRVRADARASVTSFSLGAPFPNPATAGVTIDLAVPQPAADATIVVYDVSGRLVRTLLRGPVDQGVHRAAWDGRDEAGARAAAGVYFVKSRAGSSGATRKVVLLP
jgi:hypothetical protein